MKNISILQLYTIIEANQINKIIPDLAVKKSQISRVFCRNTCKKNATVLLVVMHDIFQEIVTITSISLYSLVALVTF